MSEEIAITVNHLGKLFKVYPDSYSRVVEWLTFGKVKRHMEKVALKDITFDVPRGSALGVCGANGAGKSTLLKVLTGITPPSSGSFECKGRVASLLELGAGFHPEFSGRDNIFMNAAIMGIPKSEVQRRFEEIADFAELGEYLWRPVRTYSSGMAMRLGFSVAMMSNPEILILDEILAVGDQRFQKKCMTRIREIRQSGTTILFVSHSLYHVRQICDRAIWIHDGQMITQGDPTAVTDEYQNFQFSQDAGMKAQLEYATGQSGSSEMPHLHGMRICLKGSYEGQTEFRTGDVVDLRLSFKNPSGEGRYHVGAIVLRNDDLAILGSRTFDHGLCVEGTEGEVILRMPLELLAGEYYISGYLLDEEAEQIVDQRLAWSRFKVSYDGMEKGVVLPRAQWIPAHEWSEEPSA